jgi:superfamily II DNA/RNA helicase
LSLHAASPADAQTQAAAEAASPDSLPATVSDAVETVVAEGDESQPRTTFADLGLSEELLRAISEKGYIHPTPIQEQAIPVVLQGRDVLGVAQTGTGKTAGFTLPMCEILSGSRARARMPRSLILEPTRELALQVAENFVQYGKYLKLNHALLIGGESLSDQKEVLMRGVDVLIATPGRLIDLFERGGLLLTDTRILVIDEADRMLDMGFIPDVERIVSLLPMNRQTMLFSATMAKEIRRLADAFLQNPKEIRTTAAASVATTITSAFAIVDEQEKRRALRQLIKSEAVQNALIFCNRKRDVDILYKSLQRHGFSVGALHGDMPQSARFATLEKFRNDELRLLVCSDVAARGIDIGGLSHVFNFDVPHHSEDYVHRIGRTGRAGKEGRAFTLATPDQEEAVAAIVKLTGQPIARIEVEGFPTLEWSDPGEARGRRGRGRGGKERGDKPRESRAPREAREPREHRALPAEQKTLPTVQDDLPAEQASLPVAQDALPSEQNGAMPEQANLPAEPRSEPARERGTRGRRKPKETAEPRQAEPRQTEPRQTEPRQAEPRPSEARQPEPRRPAADERGRRGPDRDRDLGASVTGFGDDVPAFMLIRRRGSGTQSVDAPGFVPGGDSDVMTADDSDER